MDPVGNGTDGWDGGRSLGVAFFGVGLVWVGRGRGRRRRNVRLLCIGGRGGEGRNGALLVLFTAS